MSNTPHKVPLSKDGMFPEPTLGEWDLLRQMRKTPTVLYGIFTEVIKQFYLNPENLPIGTPEYVWSPDPTKTKIWIDTELSWNDRTPELRPAIYTKLSPISYSSLTGRKDASAGERLQTGELDFSRSGSGTVSFVHIAGSTGEACKLGDATLDYLDAFGKVIRDDFCFTSFALTGRVALQELPKESKERYGSVVEVSYSFQDRWTLKLESQRLKSVIMRAGQEAIKSGIVR